MAFLLDTDTCSASLRGSPLVSNRLLQYTGGLQMSTVTLAELARWILRGTTPTSYARAFNSLLQDVTVVEVTEAIALKAGEVGANLDNRGLRMALPDLLIAATALVHNLTLVTHNIQDFVHVPGLTIADWLVP
jgi:tRNA(fMet)-specific endonuclease VapC